MLFQCKDYIRVYLNSAICSYLSRYLQSSLEKSIIIFGGSKWEDIFSVSYVGILAVLRAIKRLMYHVVLTPCPFSKKLTHAFQFGVGTKANSGCKATRAFWQITFLRFHILLLHKALQICSIVLHWVWLQGFHQDPYRMHRSYLFSDTSTGCSDVNNGSSIIGSQFTILCTQPCLSELSPNGGRAIGSCWRSCNDTFLFWPREASLALTPY